MDQANPQPGIKRILGNIFIIFGAITLPGAAWSLFGWVHLFLPLLVFMYLTRYGLNIGNRFVIAGGGLALLAGIAAQTIPLLLFSYSLIPLGYMLARCGDRQESPALSGAKGTITQLVSWGVFIVGLAMFTGDSPYSSFLNGIQTLLDETLANYRQNQELDAETLMVVEATLYQMKTVIPIILPALFISCAMFSTWLTMAMGNRLALRLHGKQVWPSYRYWKLPDKLIWLGIGCAVLAFIPGQTGQMIAVNLLILLAVVYCFQGFAVCVFFMNKWRVPILLRSFIYVMLVLQSFGTLVLLIVGVIDIWFDFRKLDPKEPDASQESTDE